MRQGISILLSCLLAQSTAIAAGKGTITGKVDQGAAVTSIVAVDRDAPEKRHPGVVDAKTGEFTIKDLPLGTYDVIIEIKGGVTLEGVNIKVPHSDYEEEQPQTKEDVAAVKKISMDLNKFENEIEIMGVFGNIQHAAVVLNKLRTTPFYESKPGEVIWRLEVWRFEKPEDHWVKRSDELATVHYRKRCHKDVYAKVSLTLEPALGGIELTEKQPSAKLEAVSLPDTKPGVRLRAPRPAKD
jgi:hypothetical protein